MELKILCNCGTKFKFEFEPVNGRVPFMVNCPGCGVDSTETANAQIQETLGVTVPKNSLVEAGAVGAPTESRLRVRVHVPTPAAELSTPVVNPVAPRQFTPPAFSAYAPPDEGLSPKFFLGLLGAVLGVLLGCAIWYLVFHFSGKNFRLLAVVVGFAGGLGAKLFSKDEGSSQLGVITAVFVLVGIMFTAFYIGRERAHNFVGGIEGEFYDEQVSYAKRAVAAVPTGSEQEIRLFLAAEYSDEEEKVKPASLDADEVRLFKDVHLAHYKELASGKIREKDFLKTQFRWEHEEDVAEAKHALTLMPNESDREIQMYLAKQYVDSDETPDPSRISAEEVAAFRNEDLPELKALASGETKFQENSSDYQAPEKALEEVEKSTPWMKFIYFFAGWGMGGIGIMIITLGLAYKISSHD